MSAEDVLEHGRRVRTREKRSAPRSEPRGPPGPPPASRWCGLSGRRPSPRAPPLRARFVAVGGLPPVLEDVAFSAPMQVRPRPRGARHAGTRLASTTCCAPDSTAGVPGLLHVVVTRVGPGRRGARPTRTFGLRRAAARASGRSLLFLGGVVLRDRSRRARRGRAGEGSVGIPWPRRARGVCVGRGGIDGSPGGAQSRPLAAPARPQAHPHREQLLLGHECSFRRGSEGSVNSDRAVIVHVLARRAADAELQLRAPVVPPAVATDGPRIEARQAVAQGP